MITETLITFDQWHKLTEYFIQTSRGEKAREVLDELTSISRTRFDHALQALSARGNF